MTDSRSKEGPGRRRLGPSTLSVHGAAPERAGEGISLPLDFSSVFTFPDLASGVDAFENKSSDFIYARFAHPTGEAVETHLASLDGAEAAVLCSSGMAAIALTLGAHLNRGDHLIASSELYGGSLDLIRVLETEMDLDVTWLTVDAMNASLADSLKSNTRAVFAESPTNPLLRVLDFEAFRAAIANQRPRPLAILDGTFATPLGQRGLEAGFDLVVHSATKYLGGHDDLTAGVVTGSASLLEPIRVRRRRMGPQCDPQTAWLLARGLKTLAVRWERQCANALELARRLEDHGAVKRVYYPGLPSHPNHALASRQMTTGGAIVTFDLPDLSRATAVHDRLELIQRAPSLGGVESMVLHPTTSSHRGLTPGERAELGIDDSLLRLSVGIEDVDDLWADLDRALNLD